MYDISLSSNQIIVKLEQFNNSFCSLCCEPAYMLCLTDVFWGGQSGCLHQQGGAVNCRFVHGSFSTHMPNDN